MKREHCNNAKKRNGWDTHVLPQNSLPKKVIDGRIEGNIPGRPRQTLVDWLLKKEIAN